MHSNNIGKKKKRKSVSKEQPLEQEAAMAVLQEMKTSAGEGEKKTEEVKVEERWSKKETPKKKKVTPKKTKK